MVEDDDDTARYHLCRYPDGRMRNGAMGAGGEDQRGCGRGTRGVRTILATPAGAAYRTDVHGAGRELYRAVHERQRISVGPRVIMLMAGPLLGELAWGFV